MKKLKTILNKFLNENKKDSVIIANFDGGNDDGVLNLVPSLANKFDNKNDVYKFEDWLIEQLGYESWAGEYSAIGKIYYDGNTFIVDGREERTESIYNEFTF